MAKSGSKRKKKKRRKGGGPKKGGMMMGMRSGFKNVAHSVGVGERGTPAKKKKSWIGTAITIALLAVVGWIVYQRFF